MSYLQICHFILSFLQVSTSPKTNQSQTTTHKPVPSTQAQGFSAEELSDIQNKEFSSVFDPNTTNPKGSLREGSSSPRQTCPAMPDSSCQASQDARLDFAPTGSISMSPESGSNQSSPLMLQPEALHSRFSDESPRNDQTEDTPNMASAPPLGEDKEQPLTECELLFIQDDPEEARVTPELTEICGGATDGPESPQRLCEAEPSLISEFRLESGDDGIEQLSSLDGDANTDEHLAHLPQDEPTNDILQFVNDQEWMRGRYLEGVSEGESPMNNQDQGTDYREESSGEAIRSGDVSSLSTSDATPETVTSARHFSFEELALGPSSGPPPVDRFCPSRSTSECPKVDHRGTGSPAIDSSDPEGYFDCRQVASDLSEPEPDRPRPRDCLQSAGTPERATDRVLLSSESEDYEDASLVCERPHDGQVDGEAASHPSEPSDGEFTLCEASQPHAAWSPDIDPDNCLTRVRRAIDNKQR